MTILEYALSYADRGWAVVPLHGILQDLCTCGDPNCPSAGKHPLTSQGVHDATTDEAIITDWWQAQPYANVGIATGTISGLFVVDVDDGENKSGSDSLKALEREFGKLPRDVYVRSGGGGRHFYFKAPNGGVRNSTGKIAPYIDVRGEGGLIVAPPSLHKSGAKYTWEVDNAA